MLKDFIYNRLYRYFNDKPIYKSNCTFSLNNGKFVLYVDERKNEIVILDIKNSVKKIYEKTYPNYLTFLLSLQVVDKIDEKHTKGGTVC